MMIDTRSGGAPVPGVYRMDTHDRLFGQDSQYVRVVGYWRRSPATGRDPDPTFWYIPLSQGAFCRGTTVSAHLVGTDWYRVFTPVPEGVQSLGRTI